MLRVVLDSNVIVSAALSAKGQPATVLDALREERFDLVISEAILSELSRVFFYPRIARRLGWKEEDVLDVLSALQRIATVGPGDLTLSVVAGDEAGNRYLECAIEGSADYLVTGDRHLLDLGYYEHVRIVSARGLPFCPSSNGAASGSGTTAPWPVSASWSYSSPLTSR